ncbi:protein LURP-one-related 12 [Sesamum alatum]|uniref:Protein LURP-one-related 12 n=1 Tax=Sesamum alatum TaxID=300844 RepID=A0AAE1XL63_9LAMI|nr:protein LURP-one-related 12 [Sesamum alatum]
MGSPLMIPRAHSSSESIPTVPTSGTPANSFSWTLPAGASSPSDVSGRACTNDGKASPARETGQKPLFSVRRSSMIGRSSMTVEVYRNGGEEYQIEGSFACRKCTIYNAEREAVAEIRRKVDACANVVLGKDVFLLSVKPGFDGAFAMGLVLVLDQIHGAADHRHDADGENDTRLAVRPTNEVF